ncbi:hypothetical protein JKP88DRAFT_299370 [Tribonema minus]|uniref:ATPase domain-containing protein n=1 Tax=Tribonema minus TaxID=303371 RepID=A0A835Z9K5_9STRA|nr:hypothetical protein JKP88DRAFT_299370 [Tribonema minus]
MALNALVLPPSLTALRTPAPDTTRRRRQSHSVSPGYAPLTAATLAPPPPPQYNAGCRVKIALSASRPQIGRLSLRTSMCDTDTGAGAGPSYPWWKVPCYNREEKMREMHESLTHSPSLIQVWLGPGNCGKTKMIVEYLEQHNADGTICYINCRGVTSGMFVTELATRGLSSLVRGWFQADLDSFETLKAILQDNVTNAIRGLRARVTSAISGTLTLPAPTPLARNHELTISALDAITKLQGQGAAYLQPAAVAAVIDAYLQLLAVWENTRETARLRGEFQWPVLIIDHADILLGWLKRDEEHGGDLQRLFDFFVDVCARDRRCHVVLVPVHYGFQQQLSQLIDSNSWSTEVIGDFTEPKARDFLQKLLKRPVSDGEWAAVYEVCGGNAGSLRSAVSDYDLVQPPKLRVDQELRDLQAADSKAGCAMQRTFKFKLTQQTATATSRRGKEVREHPRIASITTWFTRTLSWRGRQESALLALVRESHLGLRPFSSWARDIDAAAYGPSNARDDVVTAIGALYKYRMTRRRTKFVKALEHWRLHQ